MDRKIGFSQTEKHYEQIVICSTVTPLLNVYDDGASIVYNA